ncbi:transcription factor TGA1-like [Rutidosis leptorrhynchoides]|uniref:transcription factor TGA1-like n=1 Tax=Rutidosis leptorrhynchoides TaxID=125765 RepID=UPI003A99A51C
MIARTGSNGYKFKKYMLDQCTDNDIDPINNNIFKHYKKLFNLKTHAAKINVMPVVFGSWMSHVEQFLAWVGGFKPSFIVTLISNHVLLSEQQAEKMELLKIDVVKEEMNITSKITNLQDTLSDSF